MSITTRLTEQLGIRHPIVSAPMDVIAGGKLAGAVSAAGGLGLLGGGYAEDADWFAREFAAAGNQSVGCGFITWALRRSPHLLDAVIARKPKAIFLSFDDPEPFASHIRAAGIPVFCQLQTRADAERAIAQHFNESRTPFSLKYIDPSYAIRSAPATAHDSAFCLLLGQYAAHAGMSGRTDMVVGFWNHQFTHVPIRLAVSARKTIDPEGTLWSSVLASTGQPRNLG